MSPHNPPLTPDDAWRLAFDAGLEGYPLVALDAARRAHPAPPNQFLHARAEEIAAGLCAPNPHVIYSSAWLDLRAGPVIISLPNLRARHFAMPMIDAWGSIFTSMGVRRDGEAARHLAVVGPQWGGCGAADLPVVRAPTNTVWLLGRTLADPLDDEGDGPWNDYFLTAKGRPSEAPATTPPSPVRPWPDWPAPKFIRIGADALLGRMAALAHQHPAPHGGGLSRRLSRLGGAPGVPFELSRLPEPLAEAVEAGLAEALARIEAAASPEAGPSATGGWSLLARPGEGRLHPVARAAIVRRGFGFHLREDMIYFVASRDAEGGALHGDGAYRLRFEPRGLPCVGAYWSLAAYGPDGRAPDAVGGRCGLSSRDPLSFSADGALEVRIQARKPAGPRGMNWLPTPPGPFHLVLRACWPGRPVLDGRWTPPPVRRAVAERPSAKVARPPRPTASGGPEGQLRDQPDSPPPLNP